MKPRTASGARSTPTVTKPPISPGSASCLLMMSGRKPGALQESLALFERAVIDRPDDPVVLFNYASTLSSAGRQFDALDVAQRVLEVTPDDPDLHDLIRRIRERCALH